MPRKKILIVDDSAFMRLVLKNILVKQYDIVEADSAVTGEAQIGATQPDLILLDIVMPGADDAGIGLLKKAMKANPKRKIVIITAVGQSTIVAECRRCGALGYIVKPFDEADVLGKVNGCLG